MRPRSRWHSSFEHSSQLRVTHPHRSRLCAGKFVSCATFHSARRGHDASAEEYAPSSRTHIQTRSRSERSGADRRRDCPRPRGRTCARVLGSPWSWRRPTPTRSSTAADSTAWLVNAASGPSCAPPSSNDTPARRPSSVPTTGPPIPGPRAGSAVELHQAGAGVSGAFLSVTAGEPPDVPVGPSGDPSTCPATAGSLRRKSVVSWPHDVWIALWSRRDQRHPPPGPCFRGRFAVP